MVLERRVPTTGTSKKEHADRVGNTLCSQSGAGLGVILLNGE